MDKRPRQRLDKWLWHARFGRTRTLAAKSIQAGNIRLNKVKILKPAHAVAAGDILTIYLNGIIKVIRVRDLADRRGSPEVAALLYDDLSSQYGTLPGDEPQAGAQGSYSGAKERWSGGQGINSHV